MSLHLPCTAVKATFQANRLTETWMGGSAASKAIGPISIDSAAEGWPNVLTAVGVGRFVVVAAAVVAVHAAVARVF